VFQRDEHSFECAGHAEVLGDDVLGTTRYGQQGHAPAGQAFDRFAYRAVPTNYEYGPGFIGGFRGQARGIAGPLRELHVKLIAVGGQHGGQLLEQAPALPPSGYRIDDGPHELHGNSRRPQPGVVRPVRRKPGRTVDLRQVGICSSRWRACQPGRTGLRHHA